MSYIKKYLQAVLIWSLIIPLAILNGGFRDYVLIGLGRPALPISGIILCVCIFAVALALIPKIRGCKKRDYIIFGLMWFVLTNLFDLIMFLKQGKGFEELLQAYNFVSGNLWILVVATALLAPIVTAKVKKLA